jgi:hypothetical protein
MDTGGSFPGGKAAGGEADHSPPSSAEVKNAWSYTSTPQYVFMAWCLVKHRDNFTFTFLVHHKHMNNLYVINITHITIRKFYVAYDNINIAGICTSGNYSEICVTDLHNCCFMIPVALLI